MIVAMSYTSNYSNLHRHIKHLLLRTDKPINMKFPGNLDDWLSVIAGVIAAASTALILWQAS